MGHTTLCKLPVGDTVKFISADGQTVVGIARDMWSAPGLGNKLGYLLRAPGWSHDGSRETSDMIRARWQARVGTVAPQATSVADRNPIAGAQEAA